MRRTRRLGGGRAASDEAARSCSACWVGGGVGIGAGTATPPRETESPMVDADTPLSPVVRHARREDREAVTRTVSAAFAQDPAWLFLLGARYDQLAPRFA